MKRKGVCIKPSYLRVVKCFFHFIWSFCNILFVDKYHTGTLGTSQVFYWLPFCKIKRNNSSANFSVSRVLQWPWYIKHTSVFRVSGFYKKASGETSTFLLLLLRNTIIAMLLIIAMIVSAHCQYITDYDSVVF